MQTTRTPLLSPHLATSRTTLDIDSPHDGGYGQFRESRITIDTDARLDSPGEPFWLAHPKLTGVVSGAVAFGLVAGATGITFATTHDWLAAAAVFGLGNTLMGCVGNCILNRLSESSA